MERALFSALSAFSKPHKAKARSGIYGQATASRWQPGADVMESFYFSNCLVVVRDAKSNRKIKQVRANRYGKYTIPLAPGKYRIESAETLAIPSTTVWRGYYTEAPLYRLLESNSHENDAEGY